MNQSFVYGIHAVTALLQQAPKTIQKLYVQAGKQEQRLQNLIQLAQQQNISVETIARSELDSWVAAKPHQGIIAVVTENDKEQNLESLVEALTTPAFLLILDNVQDPHNLGACLRAANAAGVHAVIAPKDRAVGITPVVRKVASGAAEITPFIQVTNLARTLKWLQQQNIWIYGLAEQGTIDLYDIDLTGNIALVLGNEAEGLRRLTRDHCDQLLKIPTIGKISSLNVAVATGVCLFEAMRQRLKR